MFERVAYGLTDDLPAFASLTPVEAGAKLRSMGCDGIFLKVLERGWVDGLHAAGLRVYASQAIFLAKNDLWDQFPNSHPITAAGAPAPVQDWYRPALPVDAQIRDYRLKQLERLIETLPLDGVWLDFIRWPARWEMPAPQLYDSSFDPLTLKLFETETGVRLPADVAETREAAAWLLSHASEQWFAWRCQQIAAFVEAARQIVDRFRPRALLGVFMVPWTGMDAGQFNVDGVSLHAPHIRITGQDPVQLSHHADVLSPMVYHRLCGRGTAWIGDVTGWLKETADCAVWPVVEAIEPATAYDASEFAAACHESIAASADGLIVFKLEGLLADVERTSVWQSLAKSDGSSQPPSRNL